MQCPKNHTIIHIDHEMTILVMQHIIYQNVSIKIHKKYKILAWYIMNMESEKYLHTVSGLLCIMLSVTLVLDCV